MCKALMSIHPEHAENILKGNKKIEFRKVKCRESIDSIIIYSTSPVMKVVGEAEVIEVIIDAPNVIWSETYRRAGISKKYYDNYFKNKNVAVAYVLGRVKEYNRPKELSCFGISTAPQSFVYIK